MAGIVICTASSPAEISISSSSATLDFTTSVRSFPSSKVPGGWIQRWSGNEVRLESKAPPHAADDTLIAGGSERVVEEARELLLGVGT